MGRTAEGYKVRWRGERRGYTVRFSLDGARPELSTGIRRKGDRAAADREARKIYAEHVTGARRPRRPGDRPPDAPLAKRVSEWLAQHPVRPVTRKSYEDYSAAWVKEWPTLHLFTTEGVERYASRRLQGALRKTVASELSALRRFAAWLARERLWTVEVPLLPKGVSGTPYKRRSRARAPELTPAEVRKVLAALPERSGQHGFPVRARFVLAYETSLRPATLDKLRVPDNYTRGARSLIMTEADDKEAYGREVPLTLRARRALDSVLPREGVIFGEHDYIIYLRRARKALPPHKAKVFTWQHLRSARITHWLEQTGDLPGVMYLAGHKHASTTSRYVRPSLRAAQNVLRRAR